MLKGKWNRKIRSAVAAAVVLGMLSGCAAMPKPVSFGGENAEKDSGDTSGGGTDRSGAGEDGQTGGDGEGAGDMGKDPQAFGVNRPFLVKTSAKEEPDIVGAGVEAYTIDPDLGNIVNREQFYLQDEVRDLLVKNGFVVAGSAGSEFFEVYERNRYGQIPNFITVDSLMHTYHLYFSHLLKNIERDYLKDRLTRLSSRMLSNSINQYEILKGSEWEEAAGRNVAYFTVGAKLLGDGTEANDYVKDVVDQELERIGQAQGILISGITGLYEDYTQYIPRGYYEGDPELEQYFRAMMWYGRIHFRQDEEELDRSALLITKALYDDAESYELWESLYAVTSFFAGASDDMGVCEYEPVIRDAYGEDITVEGLAGTTDAFEFFHTMTGMLSVPRINSLPIEDGEDNVIPGFRFMGQRFTIDGAVMQKLIYSSTGSNGAGETRMLPDVLDLPAALGSDTALEILQRQGDTDYEGYMENMTKLRADLSQETELLWSASLYAGWLNTLRPLLTPKGEGYPMFMRSEEWTKKNLECFAGSFTELKHDTILYSKQVIAEMGGGEQEEIDDRGYVELEPLVYFRFADLAEETAEGLKRYGMLSPADEENLSRLVQIAEQLLTMSNKELRDETLTEEEYEFIRNYGGNIEHFWYEVMSQETGLDRVDSREYPAALAVDIATNPNGEVLEAATGNPSRIYVAVKVDGTLRIATGSVYSFYQFSWPLEDRLTDSKWRYMMGLEADEDGNYNPDEKPVEKPEWTMSYRYMTGWD